MAGAQRRGLPQPNQIAQGFGFVSSEDRAKWDQERQAREANKAPSIVGEFFKGAFSSASEVRRDAAQARLRAAHQVAAQEEHDIATATRRTITQVETVDVFERDNREKLGGGLDF